MLRSSICKSIDKPGTESQLTLLTHYFPRPHSFPVLATPLPPTLTCSLMWFASFRSFCCFSHYMLMSGSTGLLNLISTHTRTHRHTHKNSLNWHTHTHTHLLALTCWSWSGWSCVIGQTASFACLLRLRWPFDIINCNTEQLRYDFRPLSWPRLLRPPVIRTPPSTGAGPGQWGYTF